MRGAREHGRRDPYCDYRRRKVHDNVEMRGEWDRNGRPRSREHAQTMSIECAMESGRTEAGTSASRRVGLCTLACTGSGIATAAASIGLGSSMLFESAGDATQVLDGAALNVGENGGSLSSSMSRWSMPPMEMFVESLSEKLSIELRRVPRWMKVGIVTRPKPLEVGFDLVKR